MKNVLIVLFVFVTGILSAENQNHYILGTNGLNSAVKSFGFSFEPILTIYQIDKINGQNGKKISLRESKANTNLYYIQNFFSYFSCCEIFGGTLGCQANIPFATNTPESAVLNKSLNFNSNSPRLSDIYVEPINIIWRFDQLFIMTAYGFYAPTGQYKAFSQNNSGLGNWGQAFTLASTFFWDYEKTFSASVYANYEFHSRKRGTNFTPGNNFCLDWGVGKALCNTFFNEVITVGVVGYFERQTSLDTGSGVPKFAKRIRDKVFAVGPEVDVMFPSLKGGFTMRYEIEFNAVSRTQGKTLTVSANLTF